ncbi:hypothetical protein N7493_004098 [Penicillium malachiteum]|uniref:PH domain-containing protein n=1 Tax=Penicillium malachiteum TaxID=1324776 RepID=A0AAD6HQW9_9EURO|nr:hypothetical protein N7493_004098 [Penicillium malachiteum]
MAAPPPMPGQDPYSSLNRAPSLRYGALQNPSYRNSYADNNSNHSILEDGLSQPNSIALGTNASDPRRSVSRASHAPSMTPSQGSLSRKGSKKISKLSRSRSSKSLDAGRLSQIDNRERYLDGPEDVNSALVVPIPTNGNPTEVLSNRFQAWRKILKDLIVFFKEVQKSYEARSKLFLSASNVINNQTTPAAFLQSGGLAEATEILRDFHRQGYAEANKAVEVETEVISQLTGLRSDLQKKTKEIKNLSGDFKNTVDKEIDSTRKAVRNLHESLGLVDTDPSATSGKGDPFLLRLNVDRQVEKQIVEENYLHNAYLNLENSGRELESIVVSEIQKAYNAYASILKREADEAYDTAEKLRMGPISMPHDHEWNAFVAHTDELVDPHIPLRHVENITYPGKDHPAAAEVRAGMLERKSKYLKSYTPGWYVLSPTHLHEFKSADRVEWQTPVMSLYLPEQRLGSHSNEGSSSHKFMLKGRQTGAMHRGHSWVFRAESHETMEAWREDIENLSNKTGEARNAFVRSASVKRNKRESVMSTHSDFFDDDEADERPFSSQSAVYQEPERPMSATRPAGGAFSSDVQIDRHLQEPLSPSSRASSGGIDVAAAAAAYPDGNTMDSYSHYNNQESQQAAALVDDREIRSDGDASVMAVPGVIAVTDPRRESSAPPNVARRESVSTAPTNTNQTDYTNNTLATSVDEIPGPSGVGIVVPVPRGAGVKNNSVPNLVNPNRVSQDSALKYEEKIPGHWPHTNVAA